MFHPYSPRFLDSLGVESVCGFRLKTYAIRFSGAGFDRDALPAAGRSPRVHYPARPSPLAGRGSGLPSCIRAGLAITLCSAGGIGKTNCRSMSSSATRAVGGRPRTANPSVCGVCRP